MRTILCLILLFNLSFFQAQSIKQIRSTVSSINTYKDYEIKSLDDSSFADDEVPDNGQSVKGYFRGKELCKIIHFVGLSYKNVVVEYYFENEKLIFVSESEFQTLGKQGELVKPKLINVWRYYFNNRKMISKDPKPNDSNIDFLKRAEAFKKDLNEK